MTRSLKAFLALLILPVAAVGWLAWSRLGEARRWEQLRPTVPAPAGESMPGLDARLAACAAKFAAPPPDRAALAEFAQLCQANGRPAEAMRAYGALLIADPGEARWPHLLAGLLTGYGRLDEALPLLEKAAALAPAEPVVWQRLGEARLKNNRGEEAAAAFNQVLKLRPADIHALFGLARCDLQAGRLTAARGRLQEAVAADPTFPGAQSLLATVWERLGNPAAADVARRRVSGDGRYTAAPDPWAVDLSAYGHDPYALLVAASALVADDRARAAFPLLERALVLAPHDARIHRRLGDTHLRVGELAAARAPFERALALAPGDEKIRTDLVNVLKALADTAAAEQVVLDGVTACPDSDAFRFEAGLIAARRGLLDEAIARFNEVWTRVPNQAAAPCELAAAYFSAGRTVDGEAVLEKLSVQHPDDPGVLTLLVRHGIETRDPRTAGWLRRAQSSHRPPPLLAELRQAYLARFGVMP